MISFVIPAHNEEGFLRPTIQAIHRACLALDETYEIVVVDDDSSDRTSVIATEEGAAVVLVGYRQIAATRHAGAAAARGDILIFVDADTLVHAPAVHQALEVLRNGAVGGAAVGLFDGKLPLYASAMAALWTRLARVATLTTGCFLFCTRAAYEAVGGFDRTLFVFEDVALGRALSRIGRIVVLPDTVSTSGRNLRAHSLADAGRMLLAIARDGRGFLRSREGLSYWYAAHRRALPRRGRTKQ